MFGTEVTAGPWNLRERKGSRIVARVICVAKAGTILTKSKVFVAKPRFEWGHGSLFVFSLATFLGVGLYNLRRLETTFV